MEQERNQERNEVYERIPWETLDEKKGDRSWLLFGAAGAVVLGALAYSFMGNRPVPMPPTTTVTVAPATSTVMPPPPAAPALAPGATSPVVTAEADLYAVSPERAVDRAMAHAEWFVAEYLTVDGSAEGKETLTSLLPEGVPLPAAPEGTRVFVEWVRAAEVEEISPLTFRVTVLARSLSAVGEAAYQRQATLQVTVEVSVAADTPVVLLPPRVAPVAAPVPQPLALAQVPDDVAAMALGQSGGTEVVGGVQSAPGAWQVVVLTAGPDGVTRPITVAIP